MPTRPGVHRALVWVAVAALVLFVILGTQVGRASRIADLDVAIARSLDASATPAWQRVFRSVTLLGTGWALGAASAVVAVGLLLQRQITLAVGWIVAQVGAVLLVKLVKLIVERDRPGLGDTDFYAHGWSFPSGHVVRTLVFCAMTAYVVFRLSRSRGALIAAVTVAVIWTLLMAFARVYLRAHFPSDAVAGLLLGVAWAGACISALEARRVKAPAATPG